MLRTGAADIVLNDQRRAFSDEYVNLLLATCRSCIEVSAHSPLAQMERISPPEVGKVIAPGGVGVTISSQSGWRMPALTAQQDFLLATTPAEELLMSDKGAFISGSTFLMDGGATASYFYGPLKPETES